MFIVALFIGKTDWNRLNVHQEGTVKYTGIHVAITDDDGGRAKLKIHTTSDPAAPLLGIYATDSHGDTETFARDYLLQFSVAKACEHLSGHQ